MISITRIINKITQQILTGLKAILLGIIILAITIAVLILIVIILIVQNQSKPNTQIDSGSQTVSQSYPTSFP